MWTPKRILLLVLGFVTFCLAYGIYAHFLGGVDGLPPLPADCEPSLTDEPPEIIVRQQVDVDRKLRMAFGEQCPELKQKIKLEMLSRGIVLAAGDFRVEADGRVKLWPFSVILLAKERADGQYPEINTVQSDVAYLRFDQRINNLADMASRKVVGGELIGSPGGKGVMIRNNRRSPRRDDDLTLTTDGPMFYEESRQQIWTATAVRIVDEQNKDKDAPTEIKATGMDVYLLADEDKPREDKSEKAAGKNKDKLAVGISGVKAIVLRSDVDMRLYVDSRSGFLGGPRGTPRGAAEAETRRPDEKPVPPASTDHPVAAAARAAVPPLPAKDLVHIETQGRFHYDLLTDRARFDISQKPSPRPNRVEVRRRTGPHGLDQLDCEHLVLNFCRKNARGSTPPPLPEGTAPGLEIETAHAWGNQVTLTSDVEVLAAYGNDLVYDARTRQSILKGNPEKGSPEIIALKDGSEIRATLLMITNGDKEGQQAQIKGPGKISMLDSSTKERTIQARFKDQLISGKDGVFDVLTLTGDAAFEELEPGQQLQPGVTPQFKQRLQADRLKVWLSPPLPAATSSPANSDSQRRRPHHIEAIGQVSAQSPDMTVHDTERLVIWFKDVTLPSKQLPAALPAATAEPVTARPTADAAAAGKTARPTSPAATATAAKSRQPIDLSARSVEAQILRMGAHNELEKLWCEGAVHVRQNPENPADKGVDIRGLTLQLLKFPEGHFLTVTGETAEVQLDKLTIYGPEVNIDQKENKAWVIGPGAMRMPSSANFQGSKLDKPTELTVYWTRDMLFNGKHALFHGNVQAEQDASRLTCESMQVLLDRFVSLKAEGDRSGPPARVDKLVADQSVRIEDTIFENGQVIRYQRIDSTQVDFKNEEGVLLAPGPGVLRILQLGPKNDSGPGTSAKPANAAAVEQELKLTRVSYLNRMFANNVTRTAVFYDNVEVVHVPTDDPNLAIDIDRLPERAMYLRCDQLQVYNRRSVGSQGSQEMEARGNASVQAREFWGRADAIKFDESKELVVFEAKEGRLATLVRQKAKGTPQEELKGQKIYYWRKTGDFKIERGTGARVIQ